MYPCREAIEIAILIALVKVKVDQYTFLRRGVPVREDTYPDPSAFDVG